MGAAIEGAVPPCSAARGVIVLPSRPADPDQPLRARPKWLANARAVCGWPADEVPADIAEDVILSRLLALNGERAGKP